MFTVPLVGWAMLSAARYPVVLYGSLQLPPIAPQNPELFAVLRATHSSKCGKISTLVAMRLKHACSCKGKSRRVTAAAVGHSLRVTAK